MDCAIQLSSSRTEHVSATNPLGNSWDSGPVWTGHKSRESPQIDFFYLGGYVRFIIFFSNRDVLRVSPHSDTMSLRIFGGGVGSVRLESRNSSLPLANNIRTCCTKVKESITNQLRICRMQHKLGTN